MEGVIPVTTHYAYRPEPHKRGSDHTSDETDTDATVDMTWHLTNVAGTRTAECSITLTYPFHWSTDDV